MTTPPHIEAIARALDCNAFHPDPIKAHQLCSPESVERRKKIAMARAALAFKMSAEICAKVADDWRASNYDESANVMCENIAEEIRALAVDG